MLMDRGDIAAILRMPPHLLLAGTSTSTHFGLASLRSTNSPRLCISSSSSSLTYPSAYVHLYRQSRGHILHLVLCDFETTEPNLSPQPTRPSPTPLQPTRTCHDYTSASHIFSLREICRDTCESDDDYLG